MAIAFVAVGLVGVVGSWGAYLTDVHIDRHGSRAQGHLARKHFLLAADGSSDYKIEYWFKPSQGPVVNMELGISQQLWDSLQEGQVLEVRYSPANPRRNFPAGAGVTSLGVTVFVSTLAALLAALGGVLVRGLTSPRR